MKSMVRKMTNKTANIWTPSHNLGNCAGSVPGSGANTSHNVSSPPIPAAVLSAQHMAHLQGEI